VSELQPVTNQAEGVKPQKPRTNVYTMMLIISLIAIITSCVLLYLELRPYMEDGKGWPWEVPKPRVPASTSAVDAPDFSLYAQAEYSARFDPCALL